MIMPGDAFSLIAARTRRLLERQAASSRRRLLHTRPFSRDSRKKLLLLSLPERIPQSQIQPFFTHAREIRARFDVEIREADARRYTEETGHGPEGADIVCFQSDFELRPQDLSGLVEGIRRRNPKARLVYLDWFAPTDLRFAEVLNPHVSRYVKKHVLRDPARYGRPTLGDTNLTDYCAHRYGLEMPETVFPVPDGFLDKLVIGPSFLTADFLHRIFRRPQPPPPADRPIDLHARIAVQGTPWYQAMRSESLAAVQNLRGVRTVTETGLDHARYFRELHRSKICFSPFGYGEVCWRDYEAAAAGAVLLKPDMSHIRTEPDIFVAGETYIPVRWDLSDLQEQIDRLLADAELRTRLVRVCRSRVHDYVVGGGFVSAMGSIFRL